MQTKKQRKIERRFLRLGWKGVTVLDHPAMFEVLLGHQEPYIYAKANILKTPSFEVWSMGGDRLTEENCPLGIRRGFPQGGQLHPTPYLGPQEI